MPGSWTIERLVAVAGLSIAIATGALSETASQSAGRKTPDQELELVKAVHQSRDAYQASLERLRAYYLHVSNDENRKWVEQELTDYHQVPKHPYLLELDLPSPDLKADKSLPNANRIFRQAMDWMEKPALMDRGDNYKRAELLFRRLLRDYPQSDKIDEVCYYLGDIYSSKYFQHYTRAAAYYEQVLRYDPNTNLDARIRAARIYEKNLSDNRKAIDLYQDVLNREVDPEQTREARRRLDVLLGSRKSSILP